MSQNPGRWRGWSWGTFGGVPEGWWHGWYDAGSGLLEYAGAFEKKNDALHSVGYGAVASLDRNAVENGFIKNTSLCEFSEDYYGEPK